MKRKLYRVEVELKRGGLHQAFHTVIVAAHNFSHITELFTPVSGKILVELFPLMRVGDVVVVHQVKDIGEVYVP